MIVIFIKTYNTTMVLNSISSFKYIDNIFNSFNKSYILITFMKSNKLVSYLYLKAQSAYTINYVKLNANFIL